MSAKIRVLDELTINKIAAGEVIENPSSVVKELIENALDANATEITIEILSGGRELIRITDNGFGMSGDDALLCLERHATSKIRDVEDIVELTTKGFRGEAVPSIASISKMTIITNDGQGKNREIGTMVIIEGGKILKTASAARSIGTTIEVKSLFFNVPVRKKFQKSPSYDANEILKMMTVISLGNPEVKFQLINHGKTLLSANNSIKQIWIEKLHERIQTVLGTLFKENLIPMELTEEESSIWGYIGDPSVTRPNRTGQYLFINHRPVYSSFVSFCVREAYGTALAPNRYPIFVMHLNIPGNLIDVNVHPQKREVRLREEGRIKRMIEKSVQKSLREKGALAVSFEAIPPPIFQPKCLERVAFPKSFLPSPCHHEEAKPSFQTKMDEQNLPNLPHHQLTKVKVVATLKNYILLDPNSLDSDCFQKQKGGLVLVNQQSAHFRVVYEKLHHIRKKAAQEIGHAVQSLLVPYQITVSPQEAAALQGALKAFESIGLQVKEFGPNTFIIDAIPQIFGNIDFQTFVQEIVHSILQSPDFEQFDKYLERWIAAAASKATISNQKILSLQEAQTLIDQLFQCENPNLCPKGKSICVHLGEEELAKQFSR